MEEITVRELGGEIWAEIEMERLQGRANMKAGISHEALDIAMACLARHVGQVIANDRDLPVTARSKRDQIQAD